MSTWKETKRRRKQKARELAEAKRRAQRPTEQEMWEARQAAIWADRDAALREDMERGREYATRISGGRQHPSYADWNADPRGCDAVDAVCPAPR